MTVKLKEIQACFNCDYAEAKAIRGKYPDGDLMIAVGYNKTKFLEERMVIKERIRGFLNGIRDKNNSEEKVIDKFVNGTNYNQDKWEAVKIMIWTVKKIGSVALCRKALDALEKME